jgi:hypothetical protein
MDVFRDLQMHIDPGLVRDLQVYYRTLKTGYIKGDWEKASLNAGKFIETIVRMLQHLTSQDGSFDSGDIRVDRELRKIMNLPKGVVDDSLRLRIPRVALAVYDVRNNRNVAHSDREISPNRIDSYFVVSACDWILAELTRLFLTDNLGELRDAIAQIIERKVPIAEKIDGDIVILKPDLTYKDKMLVTLYTEHPQRLTNGQLRDWTKPRHDSYVTQYLRRLEEEGLVHRNQQGSRLTSSGLRYVEEQIVRVLAS